MTKPFLERTHDKLGNLLSIPGKVFLILSLSFGTIFIVVIPPFQSPDELEHFYRAYEISEGHLTGLKEDNRLGGYLPESIPDIIKPFLSLRWNPQKKIYKDYINRVFKVPLNPKQKRFVDFPNTAVYPPFAYFPQVLTIALLRMMEISPLLIFYLARLSSLLCWSLLVFLAIKIIPGFKWILTLLALLPMSLFINSMVSADVFTNGISFLLIAIIFKCAFAGRLMTTKDWLVIILLVILLASSKIIYASLALLVVIIPEVKFRNRYSKIFFLAVVFSSAFLTMAFWSGIVSSLYIPYQEYNPAHREGIGLLKRRIVLLKFFASIKAVTRAIYSSYLHHLQLMTHGH